MLVVKASRPMPIPSASASAAQSTATRARWRFITCSRWRASRAVRRACERIAASSPDQGGEAGGEAADGDARRRYRRGEGLSIRPSTREMISSANRSASSWS